VPGGGGGGLDLSSCNVEPRTETLDPFTPLFTALWSQVLHFKVVINPSVPPPFLPLKRTTPVLPLKRTTVLCSRFFYFGFRPPSSLSNAQLYCARGFGFRVSGFGFLVSGVGFWVSGFGFRWTMSSSRLCQSPWSLVEWHLHPAERNETFSELRQLYMYIKRVRGRGKNRQSWGGVGGGRGKGLTRAGATHALLGARSRQVAPGRAPRDRGAAAGIRALCRLLRTLGFMRRVFP